MKTMKFSEFVEFLQKNGITDDSEIKVCDAGDFWKKMEMNLVLSLPIEFK